MQQQPSAQGIASLYRGNPQPLQQSIQKDQQAKPDLPPDLQKMLALQIVTNETDSATAQKAMDQLRQMGGQSGKPPTVMASLQQQAEQKLQAQAVQAQQKQQGIQSLLQQAPAAGVPEGTPQPEDQPEAQGIDQSDRVAFAGAEGGIVSFDRGGEVDAAREEAKTAMARLQSYGLAQRKNDPEGFEAAQTQAAAAKQRLQAVQAAYAEEMSAAGMDRPVQVSGLPQARPQQAAPQAPAQGGIDQSAAETARLQRQTSLPQAPAPAPARGIKDLVAQKPVAPAPAPVVEEAPAPVAASAAQQMVTGRMTASPEDAEARAVARRQAALPPEDLSQHDRLIAELERRKQELAPKQGFEGLMEYLGEISRADSRGRGSFAAGAAGAARLNDLNKERAGQQFELSKQAIEVSQKKLDAVRKYAEANYGVGKAAFDQVYKDQYDAAKEIVKDEQEARKLAQENTLKRLQMQNNLAVQGLQNQGSLATAQVRSDRNQLDALKAQLASIDKELAPLLKAPFGEAKVKIAQLQAQKAQVQKDLRAAGGVSTMEPAPGAPQGPGGTTRMRFDAQGNLIK
jgi:hypothetical protein